MPILAVGSVALDTIETPAGKVRDALGGSAVYFSCAASLFSEVRLVGIVGSDFPREHLELLQARRIDTSALEVRDGATFRWHGRYQRNMNVRDTVSVQLNVFADFKPLIPARFQTTEYVFLGNGRPALQQEVLRQVRRPRFAMADTMNHWIRDQAGELSELLGQIDGLLVNDEEARQLSGEENLLAAGRRIQQMGPKVAVVKKGEHGALIFCGKECAALPAYPVERVVDPTGAGDSFAGGLVGYLAECGALSYECLLRAAAYGAVVASFTVEEFGLGGLARVTRNDVEERLADYRRKLRV